MGWDFSWIPNAISQIPGFAEEIIHPELIFTIRSLAIVSVFVIFKQSFIKRSFINFSFFFFHFLPGFFDSCDLSGIFIPDFLQNPMGNPTKKSPLLDKNEIQPLSPFLAFSEPDDLARDGNARFVKKGETHKCKKFWGFFEIEIPDFLRKYHRYAKSVISKIRLLFTKLL